MFDDCSGRLAKTLDQAECYMLRFIAENLLADKEIGRHQLDYDLYLPWLMEILGYQKVPEGTDMLSILDVQRLYMDSAWELVMEGVLRPGPRTVSGDTGHGYGKGYSLTQKGLARLHEEAARAGFDTRAALDKV